MPDRNLLLLVLLGAIFGSSFLFMRVAAPEVGPMLVAEGRVVIAAVLLALVGGRPALAVVAGDWRAFAFLGLVNVAIPFAFIAYAEVTITASLGALLNATVPMFAALVGAAWLGQPLTARRLAGIAVGFAGVALLVGWSPIELSPPTLLAVGAMLVATSGYAVGLSYARRRLPGVPPLTASIGQLFAAAVILAPLTLVSLPDRIPSVQALGAIAALGTLCTAFAWPLLFRLLGRVGATATSTVTFLFPVFGITWGALFLGEPIGLGLLAGGALIAVSLGLIFEVRIPRRFLRDRAAVTG